MFDLSGMAAVVTGGGSGIGAAIARRFRAAGAHVLIVDVKDMTDLASQWDCHFRRADVGDPEQVSAMLDAVLTRHGRLDILVNNAGIAANTRLDQSGREAGERIWRVNALGPLWGMREAARRMQSGGSIINTASLAGMFGMAGLTDYAMSKAAVIAATRCAAIELGPRGIRVNCICPGVVETPLGAATDAPVAKISRTVSVLGRSAQVEEIAAAAHFLASHDAAYVTGHALVVDGGWSIGTSEATMHLSLGA